MKLSWEGGMDDVDCEVGECLGGFEMFVKPLHDISKIASLPEVSKRV